MRRLSRCRPQPAGVATLARTLAPLAGVYHPQRLNVKSRCAVAVGTVGKVKFEAYDGDLHVDLRLDPEYEKLLDDGNERVGGNLIVEVIPYDRSRVAVPAEGSRIQVVGPWVADTQHGWNEIHPAWWVSAGRILPASPTELGRAQFLLQTGLGHSVAGRRPPQHRLPADAWYAGERR